MERIIWTKNSMLDMIEDALKATLTHEAATVERREWVTRLADLHHYVNHQCDTQLPRRIHITPALGAEFDVDCFLGGLTYTFIRDYLYYVLMYANATFVY